MLEDMLMAMAVLHSDNNAEKVSRQFIEIKHKIPSYADQDTF